MLKETNYSSIDFDPYCCQIFLDFIHNVGVEILILMYFLHKNELILGKMNIFVDQKLEKMTWKFNVYNIEETHVLNLSLYRPALQHIFSYSLT